jgi:hypothetical protein
MYFGKDPTQRRNCHYLVLFNNPIDRQPIAILFDGGAILVRQLCRSALTKYVFPQPVGPVMFAVNGCWKRNSFSTSLVAAVKVAAGAAAVVDIESTSPSPGETSCLDIFETNTEPVNRIRRTIMRIHRHYHHHQYRHTSNQGGIMYNHHNHRRWHHQY